MRTLIACLTLCLLPTSLYPDERKEPVRPPQPGVKKTEGDEAGDQLKKMIGEVLTLAERVKKGGVETTLRKLQVEKVDLNVKMMERVLEQINIGREPFSKLLLCVLETQTALADLIKDDADLLAMARLCVGFAKFQEEQTVQLRDAGLMSNEGVLRARLLRIDLEIQVLKLTEPAGKKR